MAGCYQTTIIRFGISFTSREIASWRRGRCCCHVRVISFALLLALFSRPATPTSGPETTRRVAARPPSTSSREPPLAPVHSWARRNMSRGGCARELKDYFASFSLMPIDLGDSGAGPNGRSICCEPHSECVVSSFCWRAAARGAKSHFALIDVGVLLGARLIHFAH